MDEIPGIETATTYIYEGEPDNINEHLVDLLRWVAANGYRTQPQYSHGRVAWPLEIVTC